MSEKRPFSIIFNRDKNPSYATAVVGIGVWAVGAILENKAVNGIGEIITMYYVARWAGRIGDKIVKPTKEMIENYSATEILAEDLPITPPQPVPGRIGESYEVMEARIERDAQSTISAAEEFLRKKGDQNS